MSRLLLLKILIVLLVIAGVVSGVYYRVERDRAQFTRAAHADEKRAQSGLDNMAKKLKDYQPK